MSGNPHPKRGKRALLGDLVPFRSVKTKLKRKSNGKPLGWVSQTPSLDPETKGQPVGAMTKHRAKRGNYKVRRAALGK